MMVLDSRTDAIISLTAPKLGVKAFVEGGGRHLLGGRFVPMYVVRDSHALNQSLD